jgi:hypothetical protein
MSLDQIADSGASYATQWLNSRVHNQVVDGKISIRQDGNSGVPAGWVLTLNDPATGSAGWAPGGGSAGGDVVGPASNTLYSIAAYSGTTGKILEDTKILVTDASGGQSGSITKMSIPQTLIVGGAGTSVTLNSGQCEATDGFAANVGSLSNFGDVAMQSAGCNQLIANSGISTPTLFATDSKAPFGQVIVGPTGPSQIVIQSGSVETPDVQTNTLEATGLASFTGNIKYTGGLGPATTGYVLTCDNIGTPGHASWGPVPASSPVIVTQPNAFEGPWNAPVAVNLKMVRTFPGTVSPSPVSLCFPTILAPGNGSSVLNIFSQMQLPLGFRPTQSCTFAVGVSTSAGTQSVPGACLITTNGFIFFSPDFKATAWPGGGVGLNQGVSAGTCITYLAT